MDSELNWIILQSVDITTKSHHFCTAAFSFILCSSAPPPLFPFPSFSLSCLLAIQSLAYSYRHTESNEVDTYVN